MTFDPINQSMLMFPWLRIWIINIDHGGGVPYISIYALLTENWKKEVGVSKQYLSDSIPFAMKSSNCHVLKNAMLCYILYTKQIIHQKVTFLECAETGPIYSRRYHSMNCRQICSSLVNWSTTETSNNSHTFTVTTYSGTYSNLYHDTGLSSQSLILQVIYEMLDFVSSP